MKTLEFLYDCYDWNQLTEKFGIKVKEYKFDDLGILHVLNYDQIESPKFDPIVRECRALILGVAGKVYARTFDRFYNLNEDPNSKDFDISKATCYEKIDGSLVYAWYHDWTNQWYWATRSTAFAEGTTSRGNTFLSVIEKACGGKTANELFDNLFPDFTYIFELVSPETRVVKPYAEHCLYFIGARDNDTGIEFPPSNFVSKSIFYDTLKTKVPGIKLPKEYHFTTIDDIKKSMKDLPAFDEGYVCVTEKKDGVLWRVKVKNPAHLAIAHLHNNGAVSKQKVAILAWSNDEQEYLGCFPEDMTFFEPYIRARGRMYKDIESRREFLQIENRKEFALAIKDCPAKGILFGLKDGKSMGDIMDKFTDNSKLQLLEAYK